jgi:parallel beta-helix repeat protein
MYNNIVENTITNNTNIGIFLNGAGYNNIIGNNITKNSRGILVHICYNNVIYHNYFVNNTNHVETDDSNGIWDNSEEGNYWSDYEERYPDAKELDGSGVWNTPYVIDEDNQDNYPLMNPVVIPEFPDEEPLPTTLLVALIVVVCARANPSFYYNFLADQKKGKDLSNKPDGSFMTFYFGNK